GGRARPPNRPHTVAVRCRPSGQSHADSGRAVRVRRVASGEWGTCLFRRARRPRLRLHAVISSPSPRPRFRISIQAASPIISANWVTVHGRADLEDVMSTWRLTRRDLIRRGRNIGGILAAASWLPGAADGAEAAAAAGDTADVYKSIGVRPLINARGTYTIISGSLMLPEVRAAMDAAAAHHVHLDELADAIGARLASLT